MKKSKSLILFHQNTVRRQWDSDKELWSDLKTKLQTEGSEVYEKIVQLFTEPDPEGQVRNVC